MTFPYLLEFTDLGLYALRATVAVIFLVHAFPKLKNPAGMAQMMGKPGMGMMVLLLGLVETAASLGLLIGLYMQIAAIALSIVMVGAIFMKMVQWHVPFVAMDKTGWEFDLILLAASIAILLTGGGTIGVV